MQSIRVHAAPPSATTYSQPNPTASNQLLIHIKSTTIICSMLTWPDEYTEFTPSQSTTSQAQ
ncbi:unnamed protein product [Penicillium roqueforti FM164]|uniref:Genomic scaffold, ProqFM164S03 n=1 Tax=Penicillium roqueforti (strain FM164) TaxID=1365484 RepID=W6QCP1_PENRF|nr:unnamed protein product [Penicillium roqueforti FM164]